MQKHGESLLEVLNTHTTLFGNIDNASQLPGFIPNPYRTKSIWERMDIGFNLQFDNRTEFIPPASSYRSISMHRSAPAYLAVTSKLFYLSSREEKLTYFKGMINAVVSSHAEFVFDYTEGNLALTGICCY